MLASKKYRLTYFDSRWIAEPIRQILAYAGEDFEDVRVNIEDWDNNPEESRKMYPPYGTLPILELENGVKLWQSFAIMRYLASKYNLTGQTPLEAAKIDEYADVLKDIQHDVEILWTEDMKKRTEAKENLLKNVFPRFLPVFETALTTNGGGYLVGTSLSWGDIVLANYSSLYEFFVDDSVLNMFPAIKQHQQRVFDVPRIKAWIDRRPVTQY